MMLGQRFAFVCFVSVGSALTLTGTLGCGGDSSGSGGSGGGMASTSSSSSTTASSTSTSATTGSGGSTSATTGSTSTSTSTGTGGGNPCDGFKNTTSTSPVTIRFRNDTANTVYLPMNCDGTITFGIEPVTGPNGVVYSFDDNCPNKCEFLQASPRVQCDDCSHSAYRLAAGATHDVIWKGTGLKLDVPMPLACWFEPPTTATCHQLVAAAADSYLVKANGFSLCGPFCSCDAQNICTSANPGVSVPVNPVTFGFPTNDMVEVIF